MNPCALKFIKDINDIQNAINSQIISQKFLKFGTAQGKQSLCFVYDS